VHIDNQEVFTWVAIWEKRWTNVLEIVEVIAKKTMEQPINEPK